MNKQLIKLLNPQIIKVPYNKSYLKGLQLIQKPNSGSRISKEDLDKKIWAVQWHPEKMESEDNEYPLGKLYHKFL